MSLVQVKVDLDRCQGYANCVIGADDFFDVGDDGLVQVLRIDVPDGETARVEAATKNCPVAAVWLERE